MKIALFGFPMTGKSTLFRLLTGAEPPAHATRGEAQDLALVAARGEPEAPRDVGPERAQAAPHPYVPEQLERSS